MKPEAMMIATHHIGGRGGTGIAQVPAPFAQDIQQVYYEADADCTQQIATANANESQLIVLPQCISQRSGRGEFHMDYDPFMSSLYQLDPAYGDYTLFTVDPVKGAMDYCFADTGRTMETRELDMVSLDDLYGGEQPPALAPDFLSMDTQGSEYEILLGASQTLARSVLALRLEVAFQPIYQNQKLFGDLCQLLTSQGFQFIKMLEVYEMHATREPLGLRAGSVDAFGEALFFRTPRALEQAPDPQTRYLRYLKMAFIALVQGQLEYALTCLRSLGTQPAEIAHGLAERAYPAFLQGLASRAEAHPRKFPPRYTEVYTYAESMARFEADTLPNLEKHIERLVAQLRKEVAKTGGERLCVLPFGLYARQMVDLPPEPAMAKLAFYDNSYRNHRQSGLPVDDPEQIGPDDFVIILSQSHGPAIEQQIKRIRGARPGRTLTYKDLIAGRQTFRQESGYTEVETWLGQHRFEILAQRVRQLRIEQTQDNWSLHKRETKC